MSGGRWRRSIALTLALALCATACAAPARRMVAVPAQGQTEADVDRDRYQCMLEAQEKSGARGDTAMRNGALLGILVVGGFGAGVGAAIGAGMGAAGNGAIAGAIVGSNVGAPLGGNVFLAREGSARARLTTTCLEARGYTVEPEPAPSRP
jgi:hypothetical protein